MKSVLHSGFLLIVVTAVFGGCRKAADQPQAKGYDVNGKVVAVGADKTTVTLDHEEIPGLMKAMKMEYKVASPQVVEGVVAGDEIHGKLEVRSGDNIITELRKR